MQLTLLTKKRKMASVTPEDTAISGHDYTTVGTTQRVIIQTDLSERVATLEPGQIGEEGTQKPISSTINLKV